MRQFRRLAFLMFASLILTACEAVFSPEPVGAEAARLDPASWQGTWMGADMVVMTTVLDAENGLLQAAWMERNSEGVKFEKTVGHIRVAEGVTYVSIEDDNQEAGRRFLWSRLSLGEDQITIWTPRLEQFEAMVTEERMPGEVTEDGIVLGKLAAEHLDMINDVQNNLLDWQEPAVFYRVGD